MSEQDVEIVSDAIAAFERGDIEGVLRFCDEDILIIQPPELPGVPAEHRGHQGVLEALANWPEQWDDYRIEMLRIADAPGGKVFAVQRTRGRGKRSGVEVEMDFSFVFTVGDGKISEWRLFLQEGQALEAAGLSDQAE
jgi:ketosteroid isomerase-like protein